MHCSLLGTREKNSLLNFASDLSYYNFYKLLLLFFFLGGEEGAQVISLMPLNVDYYYTMNSIKFNSLEKSSRRVRADLTIVTLASSMSLSKNYSRCMFLVKGCI